MPEADLTERPIGPVTSIGDALRAVVDREMLGNQKYREQQLRANRVGAHPTIIAFERKLIRKLASYGVPAFASEVMRDSARQNELFVKGVSNARGGQSPHQYGFAVDVVHSRYGWDMPDDCWRVIGHIGNEVAITSGYKIRWGGDFKSLWDPAHWELVNWKELLE